MIILYSSEEDILNYVKEFIYLSLWDMTTNFVRAHLYTQEILLIGREQLHSLEKWAK